MCVAARQHLKDFRVPRWDCRASFCPVFADIFLHTIILHGDPTHLVAQRQNSGGARKQLILPQVMN